MANASGFATKSPPLKMKIRRDRIKTKTIITPPKLSRGSGGKICGG
jgi:hypothetical protein